MLFESVLVRKDDKAENILDAKNYKYGIQTTADQENNQKMLDDIEKVLGMAPDLTEYETVQEEAQEMCIRDSKYAKYV